jgi:hypothetical protein
MVELLVLITLFGNPLFGSLKNVTKCLPMVRHVHPWNGCVFNDLMLSCVERT